MKCHNIVFALIVKHLIVFGVHKKRYEEIGISNSSLNKLLKQSNKLLKTTTGKGCNAKTGWTTVEQYIAYLIWLKKDLGTRFAESLNTLIAEHLDLMEPIAGYQTLRHALKQLRQEQRKPEI